MTGSDSANGSHNRGCHGFGVFDKAVSSIEKYATVNSENPSPAVRLLSVRDRQPLAPNDHKVNSNQKFLRSL
jgi:hypothetical protein